MVIEVKNITTAASIKMVKGKERLFLETIMLKTKPEIPPNTATPRKAYLSSISHFKESGMRMKKATQKLEIK
ncbi:MAG: hypothetical protein ACE5GI_00170 [Candidatus Aminicenantales bacterium]